MGLHLEVIDCCWLGHWFGIWLKECVSAHPYETHSEPHFPDKYLMHQLLHQIQEISSWL